MGDLVWLHSPVVPRGSSRKLHHPWTGPYKIVNYQILHIAFRVAEEDAVAWSSILIG